MCVKNLFSVMIFFYITMIIHEAYVYTDETLKVYPDRAVLLPSNPVKRKGDVLTLTCKTPANFTNHYSEIHFELFHNNVVITQNFSKSPQAFPQLNVQVYNFKKTLGTNDGGNYTCTVQADKAEKDYSASTFVNILTDKETMADQEPPVTLVSADVSVQCLDKPHDGLVVNWEGGQSKSNTWNFRLNSLKNVSTRICRIATETALGANDNDMDKAVASGSALVISRDFIGVEKKSTEVLGGSCNVSLTVKPSDDKQLHNLSVEWTSKGNPLLGVKNSTGSMLISTVLVNGTMEPISVKISFRGNVIEQYIDIPVCPDSLGVAEIVGIVLSSLVALAVVVALIVLLRRKKKLSCKKTEEEKRTAENLMTPDPQKVDQKADKAEETLIMEP